MDGESRREAREGLFYFVNSDFTKTSQCNFLLHKRELTMIILWWESNDNTERLGGWPYDRREDAEGDVPYLLWELLRLSGSTTRGNRILDGDFVIKKWGTLLQTIPAQRVVPSNRPGVRP